ncbi:Endonuclease/exonuclease/phosphatase [Kalaharituber pfeilii]|nr:Endonuclease/exonuclease/phosphatase [Kalaharituber pfeilii]
MPSTGNDGDAEDDILEFSFIAAHLAPHEWLVEGRNQDWEAIVRGIAFERQDGNHTGHGSDLQTPLLGSDNTEVELPSSRSNYVGIYSPHAHTFFMGDLNYRTALHRPTSADRLVFPKPDTPPDDPCHVWKLFEKDQCRQERLAGRALHGFAEAEVRFPPTYKYKVGKDGSEGSSSSSVDGSKRWEWAGNRWPSWTDRILYLPIKESAAGADQSSSGSRVQQEEEQDEDEIIVHTYTSIPEILDSDHKPVICYLSVPAKPLSPNKDKNDVRHNPPFPINRDWRQRRTTARKCEIAVGILAFLTLTRAGLGLLVGLTAGLWGIWWLLTL